MKVKCNRCDGTGLEKSWICKEDEAHECLDCSGNGYLEMNIEPFVEIAKVDSVKTVIKYPFTHFGKDRVVVPYPDWYNERK